MLYMGDKKRAINDMRRHITIIGMKIVDSNMIESNKLEYQEPKKIKLSVLIQENERPEHVEKIEEQVLTWTSKGEVN